MRKALLAIVACAMLSGCGQQFRDSFWNEYDRTHDQGGGPGGPG